MKRLITTLAIVAVAIAQSDAQGISAGLRTGTTCWMQRSDDQAAKMEAVPGNHNSWDGEAFVRWERKGRWAFEAGAMHSALKNKETIFIDDDQVLTNGGSIRSLRKNKTYSLALSAQYDITCARMKSCRQLKNLRSYVGLSVIPTLTNLQYDFKSATEVQKMVDLQYQTWTGLSHTMVYYATPALAVSTVVEGRLAPGALFSCGGSDYKPAARMGFRLGVAYRFAGRPASAVAPAN